MINFKNFEYKLFSKIMYIYYCSMYPINDEDQIVLGDFYKQNNVTKNEKQLIIDQFGYNALKIENIRKSNEI